MGFLNGESMPHKSINSSVYKALVAHIFSKYDVFLFGFLAPVIKPIFFIGSEFITTLSVFATFAAGYIIRPLGAILFSHIGDKFGRKFSFMLTVLLMSIPTLIIGVLPGYEYIGILAPLTLIFCRLCHGLCSGGEFSGLAVYVTEFVPKDRLGFFAGIVRSVGFLGTALGTLFASLMTLAFMPSWGWRVTFILGTVLTLFSYHLRSKMSETPEFEDIKKSNQIIKSPFLEVIKRNKAELIFGFSISSCAYIFLYMTTVYLSSLYTDVLKISNSTSLLVSTLIMIIWMLATPIGGLLADKVGLIKYLRKMILLAMFSVWPLYYLCSFYKSFLSLLLLQVILSVLGALIFAPVPGLLKQIFSTPVRFSGVSISNTSAQAILGGGSPFYATLLISLTGIDYSPVYLLIFACILGYFGVSNFKKFPSLSLKLQCVQSS